MKPILDLLRNYICLLKLSFLASLSLNFSTISLDILSKFTNKCAQKVLIFLSKSNYARSLLIALFLSCCLTSCKVGPDYSTPVTFVPEKLIEDQGSDLKPISDSELTHWWKNSFEDPLLDDLLEEVLYCNFDLRIAIQRIYQAKAAYWIQFTSILPEIDSDFQATRYRTSQSFTTINTGNNLSLGLSPFQYFFQTGVDAVWQLDLFGQLRRSAASAYDSYQASIQNQLGVRITVLSETANVYVSIGYGKEKIQLQQELIQIDENLFTLYKERLNSGLGSEVDVATSLSTLQADSSNLTFLEQLLKQNIYSLATLLGKLPEELPEEFLFPEKVPLSTGKIPKSNPEDVLKRRPDIRAAERQLAAQTELIGVAIADLLPTVSLIGSSSSYAANPLQGANYGFSSDRFNKLISDPSRIWGFGALITWPIFDFGKRFAAVDVQRKLTEEAYLTYQKTVVEAFQEVETAYSNYFKDEARLNFILGQREADKKNFDLIADQFQAGLADELLFFQAKQKLLISENSLTDLKQAISLDLISIYTALGGDW